MEPLIAEQQAAKAAYKKNQKKVAIQGVLVTLAFISLIALYVKISDKKEAKLAA